MGFMQRIGNAIARFMYGRNGMDQLNRALFWGYIGIFSGSDCVHRPAAGCGRQGL